MALSSGILVQNIVDTLDTTALAWDPSVATTWKLGGLSNSLTPNFQTDVGWSTTGYSTNEITGGANWTTGGRLLTTAASGGTSTAPTLTATATGGGTMKYAMTNVLVDNTTFSTAIYGVLIYLASGSNNGLVLVSFGGGYTTNAGQFGITWDGAGVAAVDLVP